MTAKEIRENLNRRVRYKSEKASFEADYLFTGVIIRKRAKGFKYEAELQDLNNSKWILICNLEDIEAIPESGA